MVPAYLEHLPVVPMTTADKADRKALPPPTTRRTTEGEFVAPTGPTETVLAELLAATLGLERVSTAAHLFADLGANSLLLAQFAARVRARTTLPPIAMRDMYLHPTVTALAALADAGTPADVPAVPGAAPTSTTPTRPYPLAYLLCGAVQLVLFLVSVIVAAGLLVVALEWLRGAATFVDMWQRSMVVSTATFGGYFVLSTAAKWLLVGRWKAQEFPLWGARYLRFWVVQRILQANPLAVFAGSPLYNLYLRCLGARVGARAVVLTGAVPVCTDLLTIGPGAVVRKDTHLNGYRAVAGASRRARSRSAPTRWSASSRCSTSVPCWATAPSWATRRRCSPGRWSRTARAGTARPPPGATSTTGWSRPRGAAGCAGSPTGCGSWPTSWSCPSRSASRWSCTSSSGSRSSHG